MGRKLTMVGFTEVHPGRENIWGIKTYQQGDRELLEVALLRDNESVDLPKATWANMPWCIQDGWSICFLRILIEALCWNVPGVFHVGSGCDRAIDAIERESTPSDIADRINGFRRSLRPGLPDANLTVSNRSVVYVTQSGTMFTYSYEEDGNMGTMEVVFGTVNRNATLVNLIEHFGLPTEAVRDLDSVPA